jgi:hypothetical protein
MIIISAPGLSQFSYLLFLVAGILVALAAISLAAD